ncbi:MAG: glycosyltransferase family 4 protein [Chitinophagaceae bacterium]|nr:glycosyltransferase family 4 protein [Chitinophagaceae bacterium]
MRVTQILYSGLGGHGSVVFSLLDADKKKEWEPSLIFYGIEDLLPEYQNICNQKNIPFTFIRKKQGFFNSRSFAVYRALKKSRPQAVILHSPSVCLPVWLYCLFHKARMIVTEHTPNAAKTKGEWLGSFLSLLLAKKIVYLTDTYQGEMVKKMRWINVRKKSTVIPNGIDLDKFSPSPSVNDSEIHCGMIGRFSVQKNQLFLVTVFTELIKRNKTSKKIMLHFAGTGDTFKMVEEKIRNTGLADHFVLHGLLAEKELISFLQSLQVYVHASFAETMCTSVMQGMACGLPVAASNITGINEYILQDKSNGVLLENDKPEEAVTIIEGLISSELVIKEKGKAARSFAEQNFSSEKTFYAYNKILS